MCGCSKTPIIKYQIKEQYDLLKSCDSIVFRIGNLFFYGNLSQKMKAFSKIFCRVFLLLIKCVVIDVLKLTRIFQQECFVKSDLIMIFCYKEILKLCVGLLLCYKNHLPRLDACEGVFITSLVPRCYPWLFLHIKNRG